MSTTQVPTRLTPNAPTPAVQRRSVWKHGIAAAVVVASVATTILAAITSVAGVSFAGDTGARIPIAGFAQLTLVFSLVGVSIAAVMARKARRPRASWPWSICVRVAGLHESKADEFRRGSSLYRKPDQPHSRRTS